jgi:hypothetical protein
LPWSVRVLLGGVGLYSSMRDYLKLLRHLIQIHGKLEWMSLFSDIDYQGYHTAGREVPNAILKAETVHDIFVPVLPEKGVKSLSDMVMNEGTSWSTALAVCTKDLPSGRRKGSAWCKS